MLLPVFILSQFNPPLSTFRAFEPNSLPALGASSCDAAKRGNRVPRKMVVGFPRTAPAVDHAPPLLQRSGLYPLQRSTVRGHTPERSREGGGGGLEERQTCEKVRLCEPAYYIVPLALSLPPPYATLPECQPLLALTKRSGLTSFGRHHLVFAIHSRMRAGFCQHQDGNPVVMCFGVRRYLYKIIFIRRKKRCVGVTPATLVCDCRFVHII